MRKTAKKSDKHRRKSTVPKTTLQDGAYLQTLKYLFEDRAD
ncbi:MAG: hypothetical protein H6Q72_2858 [Firmicutes bacterium]|nr:hypothetical protein [Bacillota bacterium]